MWQDVVKTRLGNDWIWWSLYHATLTRVVLVILGGGDRQKSNLNASETKKQVKNERVSRGNVFWNLNSERKKKNSENIIYFSQ